MTYTMNEADKIGKPQGTLDFPFEVVIYHVSNRGHYKNDLQIWQGRSLAEAQVYYYLAIRIVKMFVADKWAMVIIRGNGKWYNRATFKDGKVKEETS